MDLFVGLSFCGVLIFGCFFFLVRSQQRFPISHTEITVTLDRTHACSNQYIVLSTNKKYKFSYGLEKNTIKFLYNCNGKYIYGPKAKENENDKLSRYVKEVQCPAVIGSKFFISICRFFQSSLVVLLNFFCPIRWKGNLEFRNYRTTRRLWWRPLWCTVDDGFRKR